MESLPKHALVSLLYAPQEGYLFSRSVRDNVYVGASCQSLNLQHLVHLAGLDDDVAALPSGADTGIGVRNSGGQRQRLGRSRDAAASPGPYWYSLPRPRSNRRHRYAAEISTTASGCTFASTLGTAPVGADYPPIGQRHRHCVGVPPTPVASIPTRRTFPVRAAGRSTASSVLMASVRCRSDRRRHRPPALFGSGASAQLPGAGQRSIIMKRIELLLWLVLQRPSDLVGIDNDA
jgi:hypothetical protein